MTDATTFAELATEAQKQTLASLKHAHDLSVRGAELAVGLVPGEPTAVAGTLPSAKEVVEGAFEFAGQILQQQKAYTLRMTEIVAESAGNAAQGLQAAPKKS